MGGAKNLMQPLCILYENFSYLGKSLAFWINFRGEWSGAFAPPKLGINIPPGVDNLPPEFISIAWLVITTFLIL